MVRFAEEKDLDRVNELWEQVAALHAAGCPGVFRPDFCQELRDRAAGMLRGENSDILVAERDGVVCGMAGVEYLTYPESPYSRERRFCHVAEFGVDKAFRRKGVGRELMEFIRKDALARGFSRVELDVWEFNGDAVGFYEAVGFRPFRRFLEWELEDGGAENIR